MPADPYKYFRIEARELLEGLGQGLLELERGPKPQLVAKLLRLAHTLKGAARVVKEREIADLAHSVEGVLVPHRDSQAPISKDLVDAVLRSLDAIGAIVARLGQPPQTSGPPGAPAGSEVTAPTLRADVADLEELRSALAEAHTHLSPLRGAVDRFSSARQLLSLLNAGLVDTRTVEAPRSARGANRKLVAMVEELGFVVGSLERTLATSAAQLDRDLAQALESAERLRLVPAGSMFGVLERATRDAGRALGKAVIFEGRGGAVRLEAHVLATMQAALLQVVGNAVAHGIEPEAERIVAKKAPEGRVVLQVARRRGRVVFTCSDDGRGVDLEAVRRVAARRGLPLAEVQRLGAEELLRLVLRGGLSTSSAVTEVAGRGIGLDIVREAAERLGGEVNVRTEWGKGATIELVVPFSLASVEGLVVESAGRAATIPLEAVRRAARFGPSEIRQSPQGESVVHEGAVLPFLPLARALSGPGSSARDTRARTAVIVQGGTGLAAIGVDRLLGTASVVLRALPELGPAAALVAGASFDAEGCPQLVLDPDELVVLAQRTVFTPLEPDVPRRPILIIDDSLTTRMLEQSILESAGYDADVATSGEEALERARAKQYALFLVDIEMPGMDGFGFLERTRADPSLRAVPSILVTSRTSLDDRERGELVGAKGYIVKSEFEQADLLARIRRLVG